MPESLWTYLERVLSALPAPSAPVPTPTPVPAPTGLSAGVVPSAGQVGFLGDATKLLVADATRVPTGMRYNSGGYLELALVQSTTWSGLRFTRPVRFSESLPPQAGLTMTFRNCIFDVPGNQYAGGLAYQGAHGTNHFVVEDCTFRASTPLAGNWGNGHIQMDARATIRRNDISGRADGIQIGVTTHALIEQNHIHHPGNWGTYPNNTHNDGIQFYGGSGITVRHNRIEIGWDGEHQNGALFFQGNFAGPVINGNRLSGGGYILRLEAGVRDAVVTDNKFVLEGNVGVPWGPYTHLVQGGVARWEGNHLPDGKIVSLN